MTLLYRCQVMHRRTLGGGRARTFRYATYYWLVDVDALPRLPWWLRPFARFEARDHLGDPGRSPAQNVRALLAEHGVEAGRIDLLTCPRVAGYVFNPLSVWYCHPPSGSGDPVAVVAEVHNTYGGRHVYLLRPDDAGRSAVDKAFYVSPFLSVDGRYRMRTPVPGDRLSVTVALEQGGVVPFVATLTGTGRPATTRTVLAATLRLPLLTLRTSALIRWQGIRLWLRRQPVVPRPADVGDDERSERRGAPVTSGR